MKEIFINSMDVSKLCLTIWIISILFLAGGVFWGIVEHRKIITVFLGLVGVIFLCLFFKYTEIEMIKISDTYKLEKSEEFYINSKQYDNIINCLVNNKTKIDEVLINSNNNIEKVSINIPKEIKDYSKSGEKRIIKVEVYKSNSNKNYFLINYSKEIRILKEIS